MTGLRPLGILLLPSVSGAVLLKKNMYSFLRPMDTLEHLMLCSEYVTRDQFVGQIEVVECMLKLILVEVGFNYKFLKESNI